MAGPAVACGSAVNEEDWERWIVGRTIRNDQCLTLIGQSGTHWLAGPAVACGSAVNEADWASRVVGRAISA